MAKKKAKKEKKKREQGVIVKLRKRWVYCDTIVVLVSAAGTMSMQKSG